MQSLQWGALSGASLHWLCETAREELELDSELRREAAARGTAPEGVAFRVVSVGGTLSVYRVVGCYLSLAPGW